MFRRSFALPPLPMLALLLSTAPLLAAERRPIQEGWRVTLDRGPVLEVVVTTTPRSEGETTSVILKDSATGHFLTARDETDLSFGSSVLDASDGSQRVTLRISFDFMKDGQPVPVEMKIGKDVYRALWDPPTCPGSAAARQKLQAAASRLPASMLASMRNLAALGPDQEMNLGMLATDVEFLFADGVARSPIVEKKRLSREEIDALVRQSTN